MTATAPATGERASADGGCAGAGAAHCARRDSGGYADQHPQQGNIAVHPPGVGRPADPATMLGCAAPAQQVES